MATTTGKLVYSHITADPKVCGGKVCIEGTRITVKDIVALHEEGKAPEQMLAAFGVSLTLGQVHAALGVIERAVNRHVNDKRKHHRSEDGPHDERRRQRSTVTDVVENLFEEYSEEGAHHSSPTI